MNTIYAVHQNPVQYPPPPEPNKAPINRDTDGFGQKHTDKLGFKSYLFPPPPEQVSQDGGLVDYIATTIVAIIRPDKKPVNLEEQIKLIEQIERDIEKEQETTLGSNLDQMV